MYRFQAANEHDTGRLARAIAQAAAPGTLIALNGDLGAGKTKFSQEAAKALGVQDVVNSPTFTIIKEYEGASMPFYHMDVYRIGLVEAEELGLDDYFFGDGLTIVEWAEQIAPILPEHLDVFIEKTSETARAFTLTPNGAAYVLLCDRLFREGVLTR